MKDNIQQKKVKKKKRKYKKTEKQKMVKLNIIIFIQVFIIIIKPLIGQEQKLTDNDIFDMLVEIVSSILEIVLEYFPW